MKDDLSNTDFASDSSLSADKQALRRRAEERIRADASPIDADLESLSAEEARRLLHELRVHQIELEM